MSDWMRFDKRKAKEEARIKWVKRKNEWIKEVGIYSVEDLKDHYVRQTGGHFFSLSAMRFFNSRVSTTLFPSPDEKLIYFVTSEHGPHDVQRLYTVRYYRPSDGDIGTVKGTIFQQYDTMQKAKQAASVLSKDSIRITGGLVYEECK